MQFPGFKVNTPYKALLPAQRIEDRGLTGKKNEPVNGVQLFRVEAGLETNSQLPGKSRPFFLGGTGLTPQAILLRGTLFGRVVLWDKPAMSGLHMVAQITFGDIPTVAFGTGDSSRLWLGHLGLPPIFNCLL
jgi:hypothetical protein